MSNGSLSLPKKWHAWERRLRLLPGLLAWGLFFLIFISSLNWPEIISYALLIYALYWLFRTAGFLIRLVRSYFYITQDSQQDWQAINKKIILPQNYLKEITDQEQAFWKARKINHQQSFLNSLKKRVLSIKMLLFDTENYRYIHKIRLQSQRLITYLAQSKSQQIAPRQVNHVIIIPIYKEPLHVLRPTLEALEESNYDLHKVHIILAMETADPQSPQTAQILFDEFGSKLPNLYASFHQLTSQEVAGKSANEAYALQWFEKHFIDLKERDQTSDSTQINPHLYQLADRGFSKRRPQKTINPKNLLITSLDADYRVHPQYFAYLTYRYCLDPQRQYHLFQPVPMFFNNIWKVNMFSRISATTSTQVQMSQQLNFRENRNFSSYAVCFETIKQAGYWDPDVIQEDSRLFWKIYFTFGKEVRVEPLFIPVYGDAVHADTYLESTKSLYQQMRRWAWGATDIPYVIIRSLTSKILPWNKKIIVVYDVIRFYFDWATLPIILAFGSFFPLYLNTTFRDTVIFYNLPLYTSRILTVASIGTIIFLYVDYLMSPKKPQHWTKYQRAFVHIQWLSMPILGILFGALPALDSQTRMLAGKDLDYKVTQKGA